MPRSSNRTSPHDSSLSAYRPVALALPTPDLAHAFDSTAVPLGNIADIVGMKNLTFVDMTKCARITGCFEVLAGVGKVEVVRVVRDVFNNTTHHSRAQSNHPRYLQAPNPGTPEHPIPIPRPPTHPHIAPPPTL